MPPVNGPVQILHRHERSVEIDCDTEIQRKCVSGVTPEPDLEKEQPIPAALLHDAVAQATGPPMEPDGVPYHIERIVGHTGPTLPERWSV